MRKTKRPNSLLRRPATNRSSAGALRIIGGDLRGRKVPYSGDSRTRPMKDRVREALFNLLGPAIKGRVAIDFFAGTGAVGLEAVSRGASQCYFLENHRPTAAAIEQLAQKFGVGARATVIGGDAFEHAESLLKGIDDAVVAFISPPWDYFSERAEPLQRLVNSVFAHDERRQTEIASEAGPECDIVAVESEVGRDISWLPHYEAWDVRTYAPAALAIYG